MKSVKREITKEEYDSLSKKNYGEQHSALFPDGVPDAWEYGYGYYGHSIREENGKYYAVFEIGSSCE